MKHLRLISAALCIILTNFGCSDTESTPGLGFIPRIRAIVAYNVNDLENIYPSDRFKIGDNANFSVRVEDADLDVITLFATENSLSDTDEISLWGPDEYSLAKQTSQFNTYYNIYPIIMIGPIGEHRMDFQVEDSRGNISDIYSIWYTIEE